MGAAAPGPPTDPLCCLGYTVSALCALVRGVCLA